MSQSALLEYLTQGQLNRLNDTCLKYTNFSSFEELVSQEINYRPVFYYDQEQSNSVHRDLDDVAKAYDAYMERIQDPRRIYRC